LWQGISDAGAWLWNKISGFFGGIVSRIKDFFGIHSPSTLFAGLGKNMGEGIGVGFEDAMSAVSLDMRNITLEGTLTARTTDEAYEYRKRFLRIFTPKQQVRWFTYQPMESPFDDLVAIEEVINSSEVGNYSYQAVKFDADEFGLLHTYDWTLGTLSYARDDMMYALFDIKEN
jgi:hypothetical protein